MDGSCESFSLANEVFNSKFLFRADSLLLSKVSLNFDEASMVGFLFMMSLPATCPRAFNLIPSSSLGNATGIGTVGAAVGITILSMLFTTFIFSSLFISLSEAYSRLWLELDTSGLSYEVEGLMTCWFLTRKDSISSRKAIMEEFTFWILSSDLLADLYSIYLIILLLIRLLTSFY